MSRFNGRLREVVSYENRATGGLFSCISCIQFPGYLYVQFYVVTENSLYILNGVVHTAVKETIPFAMWSLTRG